MAKKYDIDIDSFIGDWYCNKRAIKNQIKNLGDAEIAIRVNSLGGDVDTAIDIATQFEAHGKVTCDLYAFNASAATVLTLGASKVRMHENAMYLIHKAMIWIDEFGHMNEDELEALIEKLKNQQENSAVVTLNLASMYAKKSGKSIQDILNLMKEEKWLNAETAKKWGFVDEVFSGAIAAKQESNIVEMLNRAELPIPDGFDNKDEKPEETDNVNRRTFINELLDGIKNIFSNQKNESEMNKTMIQAALVLAILNVDNLEATDGNVSLTAEQITAIENAVSGKNTEIATLKNQLTEKETEISNLKSEIEKLKKSPGAQSPGVNKENDEVNNDEVETFDNSAVEAAKALFDALP